MQFPSKLIEDAVNAFATLPGIGKKTAERLVLELKDKVASLNFDHKSSVDTTDHSARSDVGAALVALGYADKEVANAMKNFPNDLNVNEGIRWALQQLSK